MASSGTPRISAAVWTAAFLLCGALCAAQEPKAEKDGALRYLYGAKFEPPEGRVIHGMGQWQDDNVAYLKMLGDEKIYPLTLLLFFGIDPVRPWDYTIRRVEEYLKNEVRAGRVPFITLELHGAHKRINGLMRRKVDEPYGIDDQVAGTDRFDDHIVQVADLLAAHAGPIFFRIGGECNGPWNGYHPYDFPEAYKKVVRIFRQRGVENAAFIWSYEPSAPDDFDAKDAEGHYKWFPGADYIDWFALDVFAQPDFSSQYSLGRGDLLTERGRSERFLAMARQYKKPVVLAESSAVDVNVAAEDLWEQWFVPYFAFIAAHPEIEAFVYVNAEWPKYRREDPWHWKDARINLNPRASRLYVEEMKKPKYLHAGEGNLLKGWKEAVEAGRKRKAAQNAASGEGKTEGEGGAPKDAKSRRKSRFLKTP